MSSRETRRYQPSSSGTSSSGGSIPLQRLLDSFSKYQHQSNPSTSHFPVQGVSTFFCLIFVCLALLDVIQHYEEFATHPYWMIFHAALEGLIYSLFLSVITFCMPSSVRWVCAFIFLLPYFLRQLAIHSHQLHLVAADIDQIMNSSNLETSFNFSNPLPGFPD